jgi:hypothetical protein
MTAQCTSHEVTLQLRPFSFARTFQLIIASALALLFFLLAVVLGGERPKIDSSWPDAFSELLEACWHQDISRRPTMQDVSRTLARIIESGELSSSSKGPKSFLRKLSLSFSSKK